MASPGYCVGGAYAKGATSGAGGRGREAAGRGVAGAAASGEVGAGGAAEGEGGAAADGAGAAGAAEGGGITGGVGAAEGAGITGGVGAAEGAGITGGAGAAEDGGITGGAVTAGDGTGVAAAEEAAVAVGGGEGGGIVPARPSQKGDCSYDCSGWPYATCQMSIKSQFGSASATCINPYSRGSNMKFSNYPECAQVPDGCERCDDVCAKRDGKSNRLSY